MSGDDELERVRAERDAARALAREHARAAAELDAQVRLLVRTEHRLTRAQTEADRQMARVRALSTFALALDPSHRPLEIASRAVALLDEWFAVDGVAIALVSGEEGPRLIVDGIAYPAPASFVEECEHRADPFVRTVRELPWAAEALAEIDETAPTDETVIACIPLHRTDVLGLFCWRRPNPLASFFSEPPDERHLPFLTLLAKHLGHALDNASLTLDLRNRTAELANKNAQLEQSLTSIRDADERLSQAAKLEAIGRLAGGIAHDFNNLLMVILTNARLLLDEKLPDRVHEDITEIVSAGERARDLTRQLLLYARKQDSRPEVLCLDAVVDEFARIATRLLGEHVELRVTHGRRGGLVRVGRSRLDQVLLNLATNARDAMGGGGTLSIETRMATAAERAQTPDGPATALALVVSDTGVGMDETTRKRIFEAFFTTKDVRGTGLGLAIVHGIVAEAGGAVLVQSAPGVGTRFTVVLPEHQTADETQPVDALASVLVVEDESLVREGIRRVLGRAGYRVHQARDGAEALAVLESNVVDLVLTDVIMPGRSGPELARAIRSTRPALPILFMSGYAFDAIDEGDLGPHENLLTKPFSPDVLLDAVRGALA